jgi:gliding motility-associated-like protein
VKKFIFIHLLLFFNIVVLAQPANDNCNTATLLCPGNTYSGSTINATTQICPNCADGTAPTGTACFEVNNTVWFTFITNNTGGTAQVDVTGINCLIAGNSDNELQGVIFEATTACNATTYTAVSNCITNAAANFTLTATGLAPNTTYYVMIDGDMTGPGITNPAQCDFNISVSGPAVTPEQPTVSISSNTTQACDGEQVTITAVPQNCSGTATYQWMINSVPVLSSTNPVFTPVFTADVQVSATIQCATPCTQPSTSNTINIAVTEVQVDAGNDQMIGKGQSAQLNATGNGTFSWNPTNGLSCTNCPNPIASPNATTTYYLTVCTNGCCETDAVTVVVTELVVPYNTITPNNDGVNDNWIILFIERYPNSKVSVYDRWGQRVYYKIGYSNSNPWDGTNSGGKLPAGAYYYVIELNSGNGKEGDAYTGNVNIVY